VHLLHVTPNLPIACHPSIVALLHCFSVGCEAPRFQVLEGKARPTRHLSDFLTGMALFSPSMMDSLFYESNGGSVNAWILCFLEFFDCV
jgi:hypothetical protein